MLVRFRIGREIILSKRTFDDVYTEDVLSPELVDRDSPRPSAVLLRAAPLNERDAMDYDVPSVASAG